MAAPLLGQALGFVPVEEGQTAAWHEGPTYRVYDTHRGQWLKLRGPNTEPAVAAFCARMGERYQPYRIDTHQQAQHIRITAPPPAAGRPPRRRRP